MNIIFVCDQYPPVDRGGYAQLCYDLAHGLRGAGHDVTILCNADEATHFDAEPVLRLLNPPLNFEDSLPVPAQQLFQMPKRRAHNLKIFNQLLADKSPQVVMFWPNIYLDYHLMKAAEALPDVVVSYYIAGVSPTDPSALDRYWAGEAKSGVGNFVRTVLGPLVEKSDDLGQRLKLDNVLTVSEYERQRMLACGVAPENVTVCHNGIDPEQFPFRGMPSDMREPGQSLRVLYTGRLVETKGAHTAVAAFRYLNEQHPEADIKLTLLGSGPQAFVDQLDAQITAHDLAHSVERHGWIARDAVPAFMQQFDVLLLPTVHAEPLARSPQEAMAMGLVVVGTPTGGTPEILQHGLNGLTFQPENEIELANTLVRLYSDIKLGDKLVTGGRKSVLNRFTIDRMIEEVDAYFSDWSAQKRAQQVAGSRS